MNPGPIKLVSFVKGRGLEAQRHAQKENDMTVFRKGQTICLECLNLQSRNAKACRQMPEARKKQGKARPRAVKGERPSEF